AEPYDLIFVFCSSMAQYVPQPSPCPTIIDFVDADSRKWIQYAKLAHMPLSWLYSSEGKRLAQYEASVFSRFTYSIVATQQEAAELGGGGLPAHVIGNGVKYIPRTEGHELPESIRRLQPYILFLGTMSYWPNVDAVTYFADEIYPLIRRNHPSAQFVIAGRDPSPAVTALASRPGIVVTGTVPDVAPYLSGAQVAIAPFRIAQGFQNKILEALVEGLPVVTPPRPAVALTQAARSAVLVAEGAANFAATVSSILDQPDRYRIPTALCAEIRRQLDWDVQ